VTGWLKQCELTLWYTPSHGLTNSRKVKLYSYFMVLLCRSLWAREGSCNLCITSASSLQLLQWNTERY